MFLAQFQVISQIGKTNEGVIVGRCADYVLKDMPGVTNVFIHAEVEDRKKRAIEKYGEDPAKIDDIIATYDKARQNYYNYHTCQKWGDYRNYNLSINSSYITEEESVGLIVDYVEEGHTDEDRIDKRKRTQVQDRGKTADAAQSNGDHGPGRSGCNGSCDDKERNQRDSQ